MKRVNMKSKTGKVFTALQSGKKLTAAQAKKMGIGNIAAEASRLRYAGYAVYANSRTAGNGVTVTEYELGRPSREIVALGYLAKSMGMSI
jgi:hypothetical protein